MWLSQKLFTPNGAFFSYFIHFYKGVTGVVTPFWKFCSLMQQQHWAELVEWMCINLLTQVYIRQIEKSVFLLHKIHCWEIFTALQKWENCLSLSLWSFLPSFMSDFKGEKKLVGWGQDLQKMQLEKTSWGMAVMLCLLLSVSVQCYFYAVMGYMFNSGPKHHRS